MNFLKKFNTYTNTDLLRIMECPHNYQKEAVETARAILSERQLTDEELRRAKEPIETKILLEQKKEQEKREARNEFEDQEIFAPELSAEIKAPLKSSKEELEKNRLYLIIGFCALMILSLIYSFRHYGDGGCDGGICALGFVVHGIPLFFSWILTIGVIGFYVNHKSLAIVLLIMAVSINVFILSLTYYEEETLRKPLYFLLLIHATMVFHSFVSRSDKNLK